MNSTLRNRILLAVGAVVASAALIAGASVATAAAVTANRPAPEKAAPFLFPQLPQVVADEGITPFAKRAFGADELPALRAAATLAAIQSGIPIEPVEGHLRVSVVTSPIGIAQARAAVIFSAACIPEGMTFVVDPAFAESITPSNCYAIVVTPSSEVWGYRSPDLDPGTDSPLIFETFTNSIARQILLGLNGQLPTSH